MKKKEKNKFCGAFKVFLFTHVTSPTTRLGRSDVTMDSGAPNPGVYVYGDYGRPMSYLVTFHMPDLYYVYSNMSTTTNRSS